MPDEPELGLCHVAVAPSFRGILSKIRSEQHALGPVLNFPDIWQPT